MWQNIIGLEHTCIQVQCNVKSDDGESLNKISPYYWAVAILQIPLKLKKKQIIL